MLILDRVSFGFGRRYILSDISLSWGPGSIVALVGANGSGKTTLIKLITGLLFPVQGELQWEGKSISELGLNWYRTVGYSPDKAPLFLDMTVREYLELMAAVKSASSAEVDDGMAVMDLAPVADRLCSDLSHGFRQRVSIVQAFLGNPSVVVLDEPTQGLDDAHILKLRRYILENQANRLIIIASHHLAEMSEVATKTVRLSEGRCVDA